MNTEEHKQRHIKLHGSLDELFADFVTHGNGRTTSTILDLIKWSHKQTIEPDHLEPNLPTKTDEGAASGGDV